MEGVAGGDRKVILEQGFERGYLGGEHSDRELPVHREITGQKRGPQEIQSSWWSWNRVKTENQVGKWGDSAGL